MGYRYPPEDEQEKSGQVFGYYNGKDPYWDDDPVPHSNQCVRCGIECTMNSYYPDYVCVDCESYDDEPDVDEMQENNDFAHDDYPYMEDQHLDGMYEE